MVFAKHSHESAMGVHVFPILNLPPHLIPQGHPSAPALSTLSHASNLDWRSVSHSPCDSGQSTRTLISPGVIILKTDATQIKLHSYRVRDSGLSTAVTSPQLPGLPHPQLPHSPPGLLVVTGVSSGEEQRAFWKAGLWMIPMGSCLDLSCS